MSKTNPYIISPDLNSKNEIEHRFEKNHNAQIEISSKKSYRKEAFYPWKLDSDEPTFEIESVMKIYMGRTDYINFMKHYNNYVDILEAKRNDPIVSKMLHELLTYIELKK